MKSKFRLRELSLLLLIIFLGGFLRFYKLDWGQEFFFHPDEYHIGFAVNRLNFPENMNPELFSYGSFIVYLIYFSALFSTATLISVYYICRQIFAQKYALLATFITAITPGLIQQAHFATPESILTFWLFLTIALWIKYLDTNRGKYLLASSVTLGIAAATKVVAASYLPLLMFVSAIRKVDDKNKLLVKIKYIAFTLVIAAIAFFVFFPFSLLDKSGFANSMNYETSVARGETIVFYTRQFINTNPIIFQLTKVFPFALGPSLLLLGVLGVIIITLELIKTSVKNKATNKKVVIILFSFLAYFVPNAFLYAKWTRFMAPTLVFFSIFAVYVIYFIKGTC
jgi:4-amino-4-deoxy-L-arabinose transferase-like glycosyltransferase